MRQQLKNIYSQLNSSIDYPVATIVVILLLIYASPFVSLWLNYIAFAVCIYRLIRYDESVFAIDYCILACVSYVFVTVSRVSLLAWLSIFAALWYMAKNGVRRNIHFVFLLILCDYMLLRSQMQINTLVLCISPLMLLYVLFTSSNLSTVINCAKAFCINMIISSVFGLIFRNFSQLRVLLGEEARAYFGREIFAFGGSSISRFSGLFRDPNYYAAMLLIAIALLIVVYLNQYMSHAMFFTMIPILVVFGAMTYSKTFIVVLVVAALIFIAMLFYKKHYATGILSIFIIIVITAFLSDTLFSVTLYRIRSAGNLDALSTGRNELIVAYWKIITETPQNFFLGLGLAADILNKGTHNIFLEIVYYFGFIGLILWLVYFISSIVFIAREHNKYGNSRNGIYRYSVLIIFILLFSSLQGISFVITYVMLYLAIMSTTITANNEFADKTVKCGEH